MGNLKYKYQKSKNKKCEICKTPFIEKSFFINGVKKSILLPVCDCLQKVELEREYKRNEQKKKAALIKRFDNSMLSPHLKVQKFSILDKSPAKDFCVIFVNDFNPKSSIGFYFIGDVGRGKTCLLAATCNALIVKGYNCLLIKVSTLLDKFMKTVSFDSLTTTEELLNWLVQFDFIALDDFAREAYTERRVELLHRIFDHLINYKKCMAFSCNPEMIAKLKSIDYRYAQDFKALFDRLAELCPIKFEFRGESYRRKQ